jgi:hypothetical protein
MIITNLIYTFKYHNTKLMNNIKKFESYNTKSVEEQVDEILDNLSDKGQLSDSEKAFMDAASQGKVKEVSIPKTTGKFWSDMSNPHNSGIMWNDGAAWHQLVGMEDEEYEDYEDGDDGDDGDDKWEKERLAEAKKAYAKIDKNSFAELLTSLHNAIVTARITKDATGGYLSNHLSNASDTIYRVYGTKENTYLIDESKHWERGFIIEGKKYPL